MYDANKLSTPKECRIVMSRAKKLGLKDVYAAAFRRYCQLVGNANDDPAGPLVRDFYETLGAYEQLLAEKNDKTTTAHRTRKKNRY